MGPPQGGPGGAMEPDGPQGKEMAQMVEQLRAARIAQELGLNDEQTVLLMRHMTEEREGLQKLHQERRELLRGLRDAVNGGGTEKDVQTKLDALIANDQALQKSKADGFNRIGAGFNAVQRAKLYIAMQDFEGNLRQMVQRARERGGQPGIGKQQGNWGPQMQGGGRNFANGPQGQGIAGQREERRRMRTEGAVQPQTPSPQTGTAR